MRAGIERTIDEHAYLRDLAARKFAAGREHGRQEGRAEGLREVLADVLERRFGPLSATVRRRERGTAGHLEAWLRKSMGAKTLTEVFRKV